jgi:hypothetical protein
MRSKATPEFWKLFERLPAPVQRQASEAFQLFQNNPYDPRLHFQRLVSSGQRDLFSAAIGPRYRALAVKYPDHWMWVWVGSHEDYNKRT